MDPQHPERVQGFELGCRIRRVARELECGVEVGFGVFGLAGPYAHRAASDKQRCDGGLDLNGVEPVSETQGRVVVIQRGVERVHPERGLGRGAMRPERPGRIAGVLPVPGELCVHVGRALRAAAFDRVRRAGVELAPEVGRQRAIRDFLDQAFSGFGLDYRKYVKSDPVLFRPSEVHILAGQASKAKERLGWQPGTPLGEGLAVTHTWIEEQYARRKKIVERAGDRP